MTRQELQSLKEKFWQLYGSLRPGTSERIGVREAARMAGVKEGTALSWVYRSKKKERAA